MRPVVLHLITSLEIGGSETLLLDLVRRTRDAAYRHVVISMLDDGVLLENFRQEGITVHSLGMTRSKLNFRALGRFRAILRTERPAVLQSWMYHANLLAFFSLVCIRPQPRIIWSLHAAALDFTCLSPLTRLTIKLGAWLSPYPAALVANAQTTCDYHAALGYRPRKWSIIHNGVDTQRFSPDVRARADVFDELGLPPDANLVGLFARWDPLKDHATFFRAAARVAAIDPSTHFVLAGPGITRANRELGHLLENAGPVLADRVHLLGRRLDMPRLNAALSIAVFTSTCESFGLAAAEAMATGVPCVVTDLTFLPTLLGDTGVVVSSGDAHGVASAISLLLKLTEVERRELGVRARERIEVHFGLDAMIAKYVALFEQVLSFSTGSVSVAGPSKRAEI
jgi:glycosyltransferase involved in cell wall biosynthesis